ncbi:DUF2891 domain-containing protein [uncultured Draconibacterium sp.]|uniref:DUF2891 domain-containing protein n=1 Tax=uncultured Draconibacterium sp. TaxID=1573823 RepID=UPI0025DF0042|nr:DUF2891 domain-containing protein [uncultured Draconibacterium sp.]
MKIKLILSFILLVNLLSAQTSKIEFTLTQADYLYHFAYECIDQEYPNKLNQVLGNDSYLAPPRQLHPAFYGCFDWHSSVHGHWTLVKILTCFPDFEHSNEIIEKLKKNITAENILKEVAYFDDEHNKTYERTYGWAWLLKLDEALRTWNHPVASELQSNLNPLTELLSGKFNEFLDKLIYPIRIGEHSNIAFGMSFAYDWAKKYDTHLAEKIEAKALEYYQNDCDCPLTWEPGGFDFLSPCLQEASVMLKVLPQKEFEKWLRTFLRGIEKHPAKYIEIAEVTDRSDGKLAHLDGLNFSRAWCLYEMGYALKNQKLIDLADAHFNYSFEKMDSGEYAGAHWLASFAVYALIKSSAKN